jgi:hypothetical protein
MNILGVNLALWAATGLCWAAKKVSAGQPQVSDGPQQVPPGPPQAPCGQSIVSAGQPKVPCGPQTVPPGQHFLIPHGSSWSQLINTTQILNGRGGVGVSGV